MVDIPAYEKYLSPSLKAYLLEQATPVKDVSDLLQVGSAGTLEPTDALQFLCDLYHATKVELQQLLQKRSSDRAFIDQRCQALSIFNQEYQRSPDSADEQTVLGLEDSQGRLVFGPRSPDYMRSGGQAIAALPAFLQGPHVTLFGPPDSAKMAINAMNSYHRSLPEEPAIIGELLKACSFLPKWGADDEDSKTPLRADLIAAAENLSRCFDGTLQTTDAITGKHYALNKTFQTLPIKRIPGLALPCAYLFLHQNPLPLHLYDFALHVFRNWQNPEALVFYVPKLENEEEARYIRSMVSKAEQLLKEQHASYQFGTIRLMIVLENPRAIFRVHEIMDELYPYFAGASLGWHDYLASTARLFKEDQKYRIPSKSDPQIVIKYIKASHRLLADVVGSRGGIKVGGMYGVLPLTPELLSPSFQVTLKGYFRDVITQFRRGLNGFWVAHPDFVRIGMALVVAWQKREAGDPHALQALIRALLKEPDAEDIIRFIAAPDVESLDIDDPLYPRSLIVADFKEAKDARNNHPDEIRYNIFQSLQYLADWLSGRGCVALPAHMDSIAVRVMDDLATTERSRWEVWHEIHHGRFAVEDFLRIAFEELHFIRKDLSHSKKSVQVKWTEQTAKWYPIAFRLMIRFMTDSQPVEFVSELLLPFTVESIREADDPWALIQNIDPKITTIDPSVERFIGYFECLGHQEFARRLAQNVIPDLAQGEAIVRSFSSADINQAAAFHGDIGESKKTLDAKAALEQAQVFTDEESIRAELRSLGKCYLEKFGMKFLVSAQGKSGTELLALIKQRMQHSLDQELDLAREALWQIAKKRLAASDQQERLELFQGLQAKHKIPCASISLLQKGSIQDIALGTPETTWFELASLSKSVASAFAVEYFASKKIALQSSVNAVLSQTSSSFRLAGPWADQVSLIHLMGHKALNLHYVKGIPLADDMPKLSALILGHSGYGYDPVAVINPPGEVFQYSGAGFLVLEHVIEELAGMPIDKLTRPFLDALGMQDFSFQQATIPGHSYAEGFREDGQKIPGGRLMFPAFAAGALGTSRAMARFLMHLEQAYHELHGSGPISHDTARTLLHGSDLGCQTFMHCNMGLGVFIAEAGDNRFAIHQGANDGFRCLYLHCFAGPDRGKGLVSLCSGELSGVLFHAELAQTVLKMLGMQGVDYSQFAQTFSAAALKPEEVVNIGYRDLVFKAFQPRLPEAILRSGPPQPLASLNLVHGSKILSVSNQLFGRAENLLSPFEPTFDPELFGKEGKVMDSWETVRHNPRSFDELVFELSEASKIRYVSLSTKYHLGNQAAFIQLEAQSQGLWYELIPKIPMEGHALCLLDRGPDDRSFAAVRVKIFPDGGFSRLGLFADLPDSEKSRYQPFAEAKCISFPEAIPQTRKPLSLPFSADNAEISKNRARLRPGDLVNVASATFGASLIRASNEHYGPAIQVISPYRPLNMFDGLESARSRQPGHHEEVQIRLAKPTQLQALILDFSFFVNNNPLDVAIQGKIGKEWVGLVPRTYVKSFAGSQKEFLVQETGLVEELRVQTFPDGGMNRLIAMGIW